MRGAAASQSPAKVIKLGQQVKRMMLTGPEPFAELSAESSVLSSRRVLAFTGTFSATLSY